MTPRQLVLRADGGDGVGAGHVGRCLAVAEAWQRSGGDALLAVTEAAAEQARRMVPTVDLAILDVDPGSPDDAEATAHLSHDGWLVVDGYRFGTPARPSGERVLVIDDFGHGRDGDLTGRVVADLVLDQNLGATAAPYADRRAGSRLLLGPRYALLRGELLPPPPPRSGPVRSVLVSLGGEPVEAVLRHVRTVVDALLAAGQRVDVIGGIATDELPHHPGLQVHGFLADPAPLIAETDLAVAAAGSTLYGLCRAGVPVVAVPFHPNQEPIAQAFQTAGVALTPADPGDPAQTIALVRTLLIDDERRGRLASAAAALVDGRGADRVVAAMQRS